MRWQRLVGEDDGIVLGVVPGLEASGRSPPPSFDGSGELGCSLVQALLNGSSELGLAPDLPDVEQQCEPKGMPVVRLDLAGQGHPPFEHIPRFIQTTGQRICRSQRATDGNKKNKNARVSAQD